MPSVSFCCRLFLGPEVYRFDPWSLVWYSVGQLSASVLTVIRFNITRSTYTHCTREALLVIEDEIMPYTHLMNLNTSSLCEDITWLNCDLYDLSCKSIGCISPPLPVGSGVRGLFYENNTKSCVLNTLLTDFIHLARVGVTSLPCLDR